MTTLTVKQAGPMMSVQDLGRTGFVRMGVSASGPMDGVAMRIANRLVGNGDNDALIEFSNVGGQFEVDEPVLFAVTGGAVSVTINGDRVDCWASHTLAPGQVLRIGALTSAVWGYIAFSGGIETEPVLGARSTHLRSAIGGLDGRRLAPGDVLPLGDTPETVLAGPQKFFARRFIASQARSGSSRGRRQGISIRLHGSSSCAGPLPCRAAVIAWRRCWRARRSSRPAGMTSCRMAR